MTNKGKAICEQVTEHFSQIEKKALSGFTEEEIENILTYLTKIHKNLEA